MLTHFGPLAFFLFPCFLPSLIAFWRNVALTAPQALRCHSSRAVGSSCSASPLSFSSLSAAMADTDVVSSSGGGGCCWAQPFAAKPERTTTMGSTDSRQLIDLIRPSEKMRLRGAQRDGRCREKHLVVIARPRATAPAGGFLERDTGVALNALERDAIRGASTASSRKAIRLGRRANREHYPIGQETRAWMG